MASKEPSYKPPRIICDTCLKDADITAIERWEYGNTAHLLEVRCHDRVELVWANSERLRDAKTILWSAIDFIAESTLDSRESSLIRSITNELRDLVIYHRVRRNHGAEPTIVDRAEIDAAIDALMLFRKDP